MEAAAGAAAGRGGGGSLPIPSSSSSSSQARKEWRAVSEHSVRNTTTEELERTNLGHSDERTIYEQGSGPPDVDFCSVTIVGSADNDLLQQRLHNVSRQREELQQMELDLRAQVIARAEVMEMQQNFDLQIKEHVSVAKELKEKLQKTEHAMHELELKMEEKDRELRAIKIDSEAAWAKEDLLREQNKELTTIRRERDSFEGERIQHMKQIHELQEHIQEKDRQFLELEEQNRVAQEGVMIRDEHLREQQAWIVRAQERDQSIQVEFIDQVNQVCAGYQRQFAEIERHYTQTIQQLQLELAEARERSGMYTDESRMAQADSKDASHFGHSNGNQFSVNKGGTLSGNPGVLPNGNVDDLQSFASTGNASSKAEYAPGVPLVRSSLLGMGAYLPPGQMTAVHPMVLHQQGLPQHVPSANSHVPQSHLGHFQQIHAIPPHQQWQNQQVVSESSQISNQSQYLPSQTEQNFLNSGAHYNYEVPANGHALGASYLETHINHIQEPSPVINASNEAQVHNTNDNGYLLSPRIQPNLEEDSSKTQEGLVLESPQQISLTKGQEEIIGTEVNHSQEIESSKTEQPLPSDIPNQVNFVEATTSSSSVVLLPEGSVSTRRAPNLPMAGKIQEPALLDERSLLVCIVRAIPAGSGGGIRISSTLPNRLGKMLAPLHWHDYKKKYGKLDDFVAGHPELFMIEGDFIHLREGAQEIISATAAVAKVAAAAASPAYSSFMPSVAVTPMAQSHRVKRSSSIDSKHPSVISNDMGDRSSQFPTTPNQHSNGLSYNIVQGVSNVKILSKPKDSFELNGMKAEFKHGHSSAHVAVPNGLTNDRTTMPTSQSKGSNNGRHGPTFGGKQSGRSGGAVLASRK